MNKHIYKWTIVILQIILGMAINTIIDSIPCTFKAKKGKRIVKDTSRKTLSSIRQCIKRKTLYRRMTGILELIIVKILEMISNINIIITGMIIKKEATDTYQEIRNIMNRLTYAKIYQKTMVMAWVGTVIHDIISEQQWYYPDYSMTNIIINYIDAIIASIISTVITVMLSNEITKS